MAIVQNNEELVSNAIAIYSTQNTVYAKGGIGQVLTVQEINRLINQYPANRNFISTKDVGKHACDCSGMIVGMAYDGWTPTTNPVWTKAHDWNDQMLHDRLTDICDPKDAQPGMCLWKQGHVGLYVGNGIALDSNAEASGSGIHKRSISAVKWTLAGKLPEIEYVGVKVGDIIPMKVTKIENGIAYGQVQIAIPDEIKVGSKVTIDPGAVAGGRNSKYRGLLIDPKYANGKYVDTVTKIETHYGNQEALLENLVTWVDLKYLNLA